MSKTKIIFSLFSTLLFCCFAQSALPQPALPLSDGIGNFWTISGSHVNKINLEGKMLATYSSKFLGLPSSIDATDPFRILVFYKESQHLVVLNNDATIIGSPLNLIELGLGEVSCVCRSSRGGFWMLNPENSLVSHFDDKYRQSGGRIVIDNSFVPRKIIFLFEQKGILYMGVGGDRIARYDVYGARLDELVFKFDQVRIEDDRFWIQNDYDIFSLTIDFNQNNLPVKVNGMCDYLPISVGQDVMCFDGEKFNLFIKNE